MLRQYKTIESQFESTIVEKKSKFIGYLIPVTSEEDAKEEIELIKKEHYNARHHCVAYRIGLEQPLERYADDGEPSGTAGMPMLEVLRGKDLTNTLAVSVRYFGGIKLGTGGLVRAYTGSVQAVLEVADVITKELKVLCNLETDYTLSGKVEYVVHQHAYDMGETLYGEGVTYQVFVPFDELDSFAGEITELSAGKLSLDRKAIYYVFFVEGERVEELVELSEEK